MYSDVVSFFLFARQFHPSYIYIMTSCTYYKLWTSAQRTRKIPDKQIDVRIFFFLFLGKEVASMHVCIRYNFSFSSIASGYFFFIRSYFSNGGFILFVGIFFSLPFFRLRFCEVLEMILLGI